jgi:hypothetical protein
MMMQSLGWNLQERLLKVVIGLGRDVVVLEILLSVKCNGLCLDLSLLDIDLVSAQNDWNVFAHTDKIACVCLVGTYDVSAWLTMPVWNVLVGDTGSNIEHDDAAVTVDVVTVSQATELFLTSGIPDIEGNVTQVLFVVSVDCSQQSISGRTVVKARGWTSTPRVAMYFFSNSPVKWRLTKVV